MNTKQTLIVLIGIALMISLYFGVSALRHRADEQDDLAGLLLEQTAQVADIGQDIISLYDSLGGSYPLVANPLMDDVIAQAYRNDDLRIVEELAISDDQSLAMLTVAGESEIDKCGDEGAEFCVLVLIEADKVTPLGVGSWSIEKYLEEENAVIVYDAQSEAEAPAQFKINLETKEIEDYSPDNVLENE